MKKILSASVITLLFAGNALAAESQYNLRIDGITCPACVGKAATALKDIGGVERVEFDLNQGIVKACVKDGVTLSDTQVKELFLAKGFTYRGMEKQEQCNL